MILANHFCIQPRRIEVYLNRVCSDIVSFADMLKPIREDGAFSVRDLVEVNISEDHISTDCQEATLSACTCAKMEAMNKDEYMRLKLIGSGDQKDAVWFYVEQAITDAILIVHKLQEKHLAASKRSI